MFHGGAHYCAVQNECAGLTNTANSLMAIKKVVFEEKQMTLPELVNILARNFEGHEDIRNKLRNRVPKFGNDLEEVDSIRKEISEDFYKEVTKYEGQIGGIHWPGEVVFIYHEQFGKLTGATPDGRYACQPMADSAGAAQGTDMMGPTALLNSMLKLPQHLCHTCCVLNMKFSKYIWDKNKDKILDLFQGYFNRGGFQLQINVLDSKELEEARKHPEKYSSLVVRVGGFSDYFVRLSPELQDEIIRRTEHNG
jgi:pyruvate-formate lyase